MIGWEMGHGMSEKWKSQGRFQGLVDIHDTLVLSPSTCFTELDQGHGDWGFTCLYFIQTIGPMDSVLHGFAYLASRISNI